MKKYNVEKHTNMSFGFWIALLLFCIAVVFLTEYVSGKISWDFVIFISSMLLVAFISFYLDYRDSDNDILLDQDKLTILPDISIPVSSIHSIKKELMGVKDEPSLFIKYDEIKGKLIRNCTDADALVADLCAINPQIEVLGYAEGEVPTNTDPRQETKVKEYDANRVLYLKSRIFIYWIILLLIPIIHWFYIHFKEGIVSSWWVYIVPLAIILAYCITLLIKVYKQKADNQIMLCDDEKLYIDKQTSIRIQDIDRLELTSSPLMMKNKPSLIIHYKLWNKAWLVDMKEREALVNDLKAINPKIEVKNG